MDLRAPLCEGSHVLQSQEIAPDFPALLLRYCRGYFAMVFRGR